MPTRLWKKGESGNPGGRPRGLHHVTDLAREHTEMAVTTLAKILADAKSPPAAKVAAAEALLSRGWGKPAQTVDGRFTLEQQPQGIDRPAEIAESREQWLARRRKELEAVTAAATGATGPKH